MMKELAWIVSYFISGGGAGGGDGELNKIMTTS